MLTATSVIQAGGRGGLATADWKQAASRREEKLLKQRVIFKFYVGHLVLDQGTQSPPTARLHLLFIFFF